MLIALLVAFLVRRHRQNQKPHVPPDFTMNTNGDKRFGIEELGTGYSARGMKSPPPPARSVNSKLPSGGQQ